MKIALAQMTGGIDPASNAQALEAAIAEAAAGGAAMVFTPEMSGLLDRNRQRAAKHIEEEAADPVLARVRDAATCHGIWVSLGSLAIQGDGGWSNRSFVIDAHGAIVARYDKLHLFDVELGDQSWRESAAYQAGESATLVSTPVGTLGLSICYDLRFPALYAALSAAGAEILTVPSAFTVPTGKAHWHSLMRARAIENACWVVAPAQSGEHQDGRSTYGHSLVIDPWGEIVLDMGDAPGIGFADIDLERVREARRAIPVLAHRRAIPQVTQA